MNYRQIYARKMECERKILEVAPNCPNTSGIYFLLRHENGFKFGYIGQAKHLLERLASHLNGYQHIDLSLKKHGFFSVENPTGYEVHFLCFHESELDEKEKYYIKKYANAGYQLKNATVGGQGEGKKGLDNQRPSRGYYDGIEQGEKRARRMIADLFSKHLTVSTKKQPPTKLQEKALQKFMDFINVEDGKNE